MRSRSGFRFRVFKILLFFVLAAFLAVPGLLKPQTNDDWEWLDKSYYAAMDDVFPIYRDDYLISPKDVGLYVGYRVTHTNEIGFMEYSFVLFRDRRKEGFGREETLSAHVRSADGAPIRQQLRKLHETDRTRDLGAIEQELKFKEWDVTESMCPAIRVQYEKFDRLRLRPPNLYSNVIVADAVNYEFRIYAFLGDWKLRIFDDNHPLVTWATETRRALQVCVSKKETQSGQH